MLGTFSKWQSKFVHKSMGIDVLFLFSIFPWDSVFVTVECLLGHVKIYLWKKYQGHRTYIKGDTPFFRFWKSWLNSFKCDFKNFKITVSSSNLCHNVGINEYTKSVIQIFIRSNFIFGRHIGFCWKVKFLFLNIFSICRIKLAIEKYLSWKNQSNFIFGRHTGFCWKVKFWFLEYFFPYVE